MVKQRTRLLKRPSVKHRPKNSLKKLALAFVIVVVAAGLYMKFLAPHTYEAKQRVKLESTQQQLLDTKQQLEQSQTKTKAQDKARQKSIDELNKKLKDTEKQLQAKRNTAVAYAATVESYPVSSNYAKAYIYSHESGNDPTRVNSIGCRGIGQACPGTKLPCGNNYACQDAYFTQYMKDRYGTWDNAYQFWVANHWW